MVDQSFTTDDDPNVLYFPVQLTEDAKWTNYGRRQGVLRVSSIHVYKGEQWMRVSAFSPDDLDMDLDFTNPDPSLRERIINFIRRMDKWEKSYEELLETVRQQFGGKRTG